MRKAGLFKVDYSDERFCSSECLFWIKCLYLYFPVFCFLRLQRYTSNSLDICQDNMFWPTEDIPGFCFLKCAVQLDSAVPRLQTSGAHFLIRVFSPKTGFLSPYKVHARKGKPQCLSGARGCTSHVCEDGCLPGAEPIPALGQFNR